MTDKTLDYINALFRQGERLQQPVTITDTHIQTGEFKFNWNHYRFDGACIDALLAIERYYAMQPGHESGHKIQSIQDLIKS